MPTKSCCEHHSIHENAKPADKPGPVACSHSSGTAVTSSLVQPTRRLCGPYYVFLFGLAPDGVYPAMHRYRSCGALLPHPFSLTEALGSGGLLSVALSVGSHLPGVTWRPALWSPDFPRCLGTATAWPTPQTNSRRLGRVKRAFSPESRLRTAPERVHKPCCAPPRSNETPFWRPAWCLLRPKARPATDPGQPCAHQPVPALGYDRQ